MYMHGLAGGTVSMMAIQDALKAKGFDPGASDGINGPKTIAAVKAFQAANGLAVDGIVGPNTLAKLNAAVTSASVSPLPTPKALTDNSALPGLQSTVGRAFQTGIQLQTAGAAALPTGSVLPQGIADANGPIFSPPPPPPVVVMEAPKSSVSILPLLLLAGGAALLMSGGKF